MVTAITLMVLRCSDLSASRRFYQALGLEFEREKHGSGPEHWSCRVGCTVVELYPTTGDAAPSIARIGFCVSDVRAAVQRAVAAGGRLEHHRDDADPHAVVLDPDGTKVELTTGPAAGALPRTFAVWRQDDNGSRFLVSGNHSQEDAERLCAELEERGHKQMYWVAPDT